MSDLTEFLLARVAEDEAETWSLVPYPCEPGCCAPAGWVGVRCRYCDAAPVYGGTVEAMTESALDHARQVHQRPRVLAECEAKRRIVERYAYLEEYGDPYDARWVLPLLALPYADHPDYQEEWRP